MPREAFRHGGLAYGLALTIAFAMIALPITLLQLAIGQLSQQDAVGIWRAVPFFKGRLQRLELSRLFSTLYLVWYDDIIIRYDMTYIKNSNRLGGQASNISSRLKDLPCDCCTKTLAGLCLLYILNI